MYKFVRILAVVAAYFLVTGFTQVDQYLNEIASVAMQEASRLTGRPATAPPRIVFLPKESIYVVACKGNPCGIAGYYVPGTDTLIINADSVNPHTPQGMSIIIHETVHHLQFQQYAPTVMESCKVRVSLEKEAYYTEAKFLEENNLPFNAENRINTFNMISRMMCEEGT